MNERRAEDRPADETWDFAKKATFIMGLATMTTGAFAGTVIVVLSAISEQGPSYVAIGFVGSLVLLGALFLKERTMVPIIYKLIDKFMKDTTDTTDANK